MNLNIVGELSKETIKAILNLALPTAGNEVYNIVTNPFETQTITRDGKDVELRSNPNSVSIRIHY